LRRLEDLSGFIDALAFSADGRRLMSSSQAEGRQPADPSPFDDNDGAVLVWEVATGDCVRRLPSHADLSFSPDGRLMAYTDGAMVAVENLDGVRQCQVPGEGMSRLFSPDGKRLATRGHGEPLTVWDTTTGKEVRAFGPENGEIGRPVAFSGDG